MSYIDVVGGVFTSTGLTTQIPIKISFDWMQTYNATVAAAQTATGVTRTYWQRGMAANDCFYEWYQATPLTGTTTALGFPGGACPGYIEYSSGNTTYNNNYTNMLAPIAITAISNATPGVVLTADTTTSALVAGDIVRLSNTSPQAGQLGGIEFTVDTVVANTSFTLAFGPTIVAAPGMTAFYRKVVYDTQWVPRQRTISKVRSVGITTQITMTVTHNFLVGEIVRFHIPSVRGSAAFGMTQLDTLIGTVIAINTADADGILNTITVDINSSAFTAFAWPLTAFDRFTAPTVCPIGENATDLFSSDTITDDKIINTATTGIILGGNTTVISPVGAAGNVIYWKAGNFLV
jgi:hypothetical protein